MPPITDLGANTSLSGGFRLGMVIDYSDGFMETAELIPDYESAGLQLAAVAELYSFDGVSQIAYLASKAKTLEFSSAILQIYSRTPALLAMTAAGLDFVSGGRFTLGLGASGPQVVEGFHGVPFDAPLGRTREIVQICRKVWRREYLEFDGKHYTIPLPADRGTGLGKALKLIDHPVRPRIPISLAALGPANVAMTAEIAESWQPLFFHPEHAYRVWGKAVAEGLSKRDPGLGPLDIMLQVPFSMDPDDEHALQSVRDQLALYIGGMGAKGKNFYNDLAQSYGFIDEAKEIQRLYLKGFKAEAAAMIPDDLLHSVSLIGDNEQIETQLRKLKAAGVTTLLLQPLARSAEHRVRDIAAISRINDRLRLAALTPGTSSQLHS